MADMKASLTGMEGGGFYNRHSILQSAAIQQALPRWDAAIETTAFDSGSITIADYGSSQGQNSMAPLSLAIEKIRRKVNRPIPISIIHTDLPGNDFSTLFEMINESKDSYLKTGEAVFPSAIGRSYFDQILPPSSVDLGWNSWTLQWMSRNPVEDPDFLYGAYSASEDVRRAVAKQLAEDWRVFLEIRSEELKPGGALFSLFGSKGPAMIGWEWMLNELWQSVMDMFHEGLLSEEEKLRINLPIGPRDLEAIQEPFGRNGIFAGLKLEHAEVVRSPDPYWAEYQRTNDARMFGENWKNMMKAVSSPVIKSAIEAGKDAAALVEDLFDRFAGKIARSPRETEHFVGVAVLRKLEDPNRSDS